MRNKDIPNMDNENDNDQKNDKRVDFSGMKVTFFRTKGCHYLPKIINKLQKLIVKKMKEEYKSTAIKYYTEEKKIYLTVNGEA